MNKKVAFRRKDLPSKRRRRLLIELKVRILAILAQTFNTDTITANGNTQCTIQ